MLSLLICQFIKAFLFFKKEINGKNILVKIIKHWWAQIQTHYQNYYTKIYNKIYYYLIFIIYGCLMHQFLLKNYYI